jgi:hypothetical protein
MPLAEMNHLVKQQAARLLQPAHSKSSVLTVSMSLHLILSIQTGVSYKSCGISCFLEILIDSSEFVPNIFVRWNSTVQTCFSIKCSVGIAQQRLGYRM